MVGQGRGEGREARGVEGRVVQERGGGGRGRSHKAELLDLNPDAKRGNSCTATAGDPVTQTLA